MAPLNLVRNEWQNKIKDKTSEAPKNPFEKALFNGHRVYRERGNHLLRLDLFEPAIVAYDQALKFHDKDVKTLLARAKTSAAATYYKDAQRDVLKAINLCERPENAGFSIKATEIQAHTEYKLCEFEQSLSTARKGFRKWNRRPELETCTRMGEYTILTTLGDSASICLKKIPRDPVLKQPPRSRGLQFQEPDVGVSKQKQMRSDRLAVVLDAIYLQRMAHDKRFLARISTDPRLNNPNKAGAKKLFLYANMAHNDLQQRLRVSWTRRPIYVVTERERMYRANCKTKNELAKRAQNQAHDETERSIADAKKLIERREIRPALRQAELALSAISRRPLYVLPKRGMYAKKVISIISNILMDEVSGLHKGVEDEEHYAANILTSMETWEKLITSSLPACEEISRNSSVGSPARLHATHQAVALLMLSNRWFQASKLASRNLTEARNSGEDVWLMNSAFLLAQCHLQQNNRSEAREVLSLAAKCAEKMQRPAIANFFDTCSRVAVETEFNTGADEAVAERERDLIKLMPDDELRSQATHLFRRMSTLPVTRRFSVMPTAGVSEGDGGPKSKNYRRASIMPPRNEPQVSIPTEKSNKAIGYQDFDI